MTTGQPGCGHHRAFLYRTGTNTVIAELDDITQIYWDRRKDDISQARVRLGPGCCEVAIHARTVECELRIWRDDGWSNGRVWRGIITRIEYEFDQVSIFAEDMLWVAKKRAIEEGWNYENVPTASRPTALEVARRTLVDLCFNQYGDFWGMASNVITHPTPQDRRSASAVNKYQYVCWEIVDNLARHVDLDYTVVDGVVHLWDTHTWWNTLPDLLPEHLSEWPRIVEYGNRFANRAITTNGSGYAGVAQAPPAVVGQYGMFVDSLSNSTSDEEVTPNEKPSDYLMQLWWEGAQKRIDKLYPPPVSIVVPEGSVLMPDCPWDTNTVIPGAVFKVLVEHSCRTVYENHRLQEIRVTDDGEGEKVEISTAQVPKNMVTG